ncbi:hypothetical protein G6F22_013811 [Rhizopus arrhizus]|nr:hypothetical protein G6F22_013811 [Rhizopus arrhizus]
MRTRNLAVVVLDPEETGVTRHQQKTAVQTGIRVLSVAQFAIGREKDLRLEDVPGLLRRRALHDACRQDRGAAEP